MIGLCSYGPPGREPVAVVPGLADLDLSVEVVRPDSRGIRVLGSTRRDGDALLFEPRFPWEPGLTYEAIYDDPARPVRHRFTIPKLSFEETEVLAVHPSSDELPANLLKLYVQFSAPMSRGEAYRRVHLIDSERGEVELPFLELGEELWDTTGTRFTLFFDPGRIKREVKPLEEVGAALEAGRSYVFKVDADWSDAHGLPLKASFEKPFRATEPDRSQPVPASWRILPVSAGSREPLQVRFDEPLDRALLERMLRVTASDQRDVPGSIAISGGEQTWTLTPDEPWSAGRHALVVDTRLEDRAGNSVGRPFEVELAEPGVQPGIQPGIQEVPEAPGFVKVVFEAN